MSLNLGIVRVLKNSKNQIVGFREEVRSDEEQREREMSWGSEMCRNQWRERIKKNCFSVFFFFFLFSLCLISLPLCTLWALKIEVFIKKLDL